MLDIDGALKFLALDNALINNDGYWIRTSDYDIYEDANGRFHLIPQDQNETFSRVRARLWRGPGWTRRPGGAVGGPGFGGGPGGPDGRTGDDAGPTNSRARGQRWGP